MMTTRRRMVWGAVAGCLLASAAGCEYPPGDVAAASALPATQTPVGPVPGPVSAPVQPENPFKESRSAAQEGRTLFTRMNCAGCHGEHAGGGMGPSLRDVDWIYGSSDAQIFDSIAQGRAHGMPAWGLSLPQDQVWKIVAYIKTLRTPDEVEPPQ
jgi:cytochrome c oxidase cbb3-type subunit 3